MGSVKTTFLRQSFKNCCLPLEKNIILNKKYKLKLTHFVTEMQDPLYGRLTALRTNMIVKYNWTSLLVSLLGKIFLLTSRGLTDNFVKSIHTAAYYLRPYSIFFRHVKLLKTKLIFITSSGKFDLLYVFRALNHIKLTQKFQV